MDTPSNCPSFQVEDNEKNEEVFRIETDGTIFWKKDGKLVRAETDKDLGLALGLVIAAMTKMDTTEFIKRIRGGEDLPPAA